MERIELTGEMFWHWPTGSSPLIIVHVRKDGEHYDTSRQGTTIQDLLGPILPQQEGLPGVRVKLIVEKIPD